MVRRAPLDFQACLGPQDLRDLLDSLGSSLKVLLTCSALPSALRDPPGLRECQGLRAPPATKENKEKSARMARRVTPARLVLLVFQALWGCRALEG